MELEQILNTTSERISSDQLKNEAQVKQAVIIPVLRGLDWDDSNPAEFIPEFSAGNGRVDYALCGDARPQVFIEAKRLDGTDSKAEKQLFKYANNRGVPLLILTDGNTWDFYLSMAEGHPPERRFYRMELQRKENFPEYEKFLMSCLHRNPVLSGKARREAERRHEDNRNKEKARNAIPKVWLSLLREPDEMLRDVLAEAIEGECGTKPSLDDVEEFLRKQSYLHGPSPSKPPELPKSFKPPEPSDNKKIVGYILDGNRVEIGVGYLVLAEILKAFQLRDAGFMNQFAAKSIGRTRRLVAANPDDLYQKVHLRDKYSLDLENGWWLGVNLSNISIRKYTNIACKIAGVNFGDQLRLIER